MKVVHGLVLKSHRSGLFRTAREIILAERAVGVDARGIDVKRAKVGESFGIPTCDREFARTADILVGHHGLGTLERWKKPIVFVLHGQPETCLMCEWQKLHPVYSYLYGHGGHPRFKAFVTHWPEHIAYWQAILPVEKLVSIPAPVDLSEWRTEGPDSYDFGGHSGEINVVCMDPWRMTKNPFHVLHGFAMFAEKYKQSRLQIMGCGPELAGWTSILHAFKRRGWLGQISRWYDGPMDRVYRSADLVITGIRVASRVVREALACGRQVVMGPGGDYSAYTADAEDPLAFARVMERAWLDWKADKAACIQRSRESAERHFDSRRTGEAFKELFTEIGV